MLLILAIVLLVLLIGGWPSAPWTFHTWGYAPSGVVGVILIILLIVVLLRLI